MGTSARRAVIVAVAEPAAALLAGALLYLLARPSDLLVFQWVSGTGLAAPLEHARAAVAPAARVLPAFVLFSVPNALWTYAFTVAMSHMWSHRWSRASAPWVAAGPFISIGAEIGQAVGIVPGTFDVLDLVFVLVASALALRRLHPALRATPTVIS